MWGKRFLQAAVGAARSLCRKVTDDSQYCYGIMIRSMSVYISFVQLSFLWISHISHVVGRDFSKAARPRVAPRPHLWTFRAAEPPQGVQRCRTRLVFRFFDVFRCFLCMFVLAKYGKVEFCKYLEETYLASLVTCLPWGNATGGRGFWYPLWQSGCSTDGECWSLLRTCLGECLKQSV